MMDKPIEAYDSAELTALIPMMILSPTIVNDGRKLYIAARPVSFMNYDITSSPNYTLSKLSGVDFISLFEIKTDMILDFFLRCGCQLHFLT